MAFQQFNQVPMSIDSSQNYSQNQLHNQNINNIITSMQNLEIRDSRSQPPPVPRKPKHKEVRYFTFYEKPKCARKLFD